jgi:hypothetical protein
MHRMRAALRLGGLLIVFLVLTPLAGASTYEAWTDGIYDADFDGDLLVAISLQSVVESAPFTSRGCVDAAGSVCAPADDAGLDLTDPSPRTARAPPAS